MNFLQSIFITEISLLIIFFKKSCVLDTMTRLYMFTNYILNNYYMTHFNLFVSDIN